MPLGKGIVAMVSAVQERIEVTGQDPTWRVTGGTYDAALAYAREAWDGVVVLAREDAGRWWSRVTITVTTDPLLAAQAPPPEALREPVRPVVPEQRRREFFVSEVPGDPVLVSLDEIFDSSEQRRADRLRFAIPQQREPHAP